MKDKNSSPQQQTQLKLSSVYFCPQYPHFQVQRISQTFQLLHSEMLHVSRSWDIVHKVQEFLFLVFFCGSFIITTILDRL